MNPLPDLPAIEPATSLPLAATFGLGDGLALALIVVLLLVALVLVAVEEAIARFSVVRAESHLEAEPKRARRLIRILAEPETFQNPLRVVVAIMQLTEAAAVALLATRFLSWPPALLVMAINIGLVFVVAEAVPRTLAILHTDRVALGLVGPASFLVGLAPIRLLARGLIGITNVIVPGKGLREGPFSTPEELIELADAALEDAILEQTERDLIESVIEFGDTVVREVMVPRTDMTTVERTVTVEDALEAASLAGFSRMPVVGESVDDVVGLVYVKDLIRAELDGSPDQLVEAILRPSHFVPETKRVSDLLAEMQQEKYHMAIAVDEYGGIAGLVTLEDLIEELVGEIVDEYDVEEPLVERQVDGSLRVDAKILIDELNDLGTMNLPEGDWDTVGGLVFDLFGRVPTVGEICQVGGYDLRVEKLQGRRITRVLITPSVGADDNQPAGVME